MQTPAIAVATLPDAPPPRPDAPRASDDAFARILDSKLRARGADEPAPAEPVVPVESVDEARPAITATDDAEPVREPRARHVRRIETNSSSEEEPVAEDAAPATQNAVVVATIVPPVAPPAPAVTAPPVVAAVAPVEALAPTPPAPAVAPIVVPPAPASAPAELPPVAAALAAPVAAPAPRVDDAEIVAPAMPGKSEAAPKAAEVVSAQALAAPRAARSEPPPFSAIDLPDAETAAAEPRDPARPVVIRAASAPPAAPLAPATGVAAQLAPETAPVVGTPSGENESEAPAIVDADRSAAPARAASDRDAPRPAASPIESATPAATPAVDPSPRAAAPDAALRVARAGAHPAIAQVAVQVVRAVSEGVDRITIKLDPPELGRIDVKLDIGVDGRVQAVFAADRAATLDVLRRDAVDLERALQNAGLSADSGSLEFGLRDQNRSARGDGGYGGSAPAAPDGETDASTPPSQPWRARAGGIDIRV